MKVRAEFVMALLAGAVAGAVAFAAFLLMHAIWIGPISSIAHVIVWAVLGGLMVGWAYDVHRVGLPARPGGRIALVFARVSRSVLVATRPAIGVRESRRVMGDYGLTRDDVLSSHRFEDEIAVRGAPIEDHSAGPNTHGVEGLLVAGRCLSATHDAHASARSMATCMAMGQTAGIAAALSVRSQTVPRSVDPVALRRCLLENQGLLDPVDSSLL